LEVTMTGKDDMDDLPPELARPPPAGLAAGRYSRLDRVAELTEQELRQLNGIGAKAVGQLRAALGRIGLSLRGE
jgi:hypothetical protein